MRLLLALLGASVLACSSRESASAPSARARATAVKLVAPDSAADSAGTTFVWYRVAVGDGARDTLRDVMTDEEPVVTPEGELLGISFTRRGTPDFAYRYVPRTRAFSRTALPDDMSDYFSEAAFAPDGRALAYVAEDSAGALIALIRDWPGGTELFRHELGSGFSSDVSFNHVRWLPDGEAEFAVRVDEGGGPWVHIVASRKGGATIDSLGTEPIWGARGGAGGP